MAPIKIKEIVKVSSEDERYPAGNLLGDGKWMSNVQTPKIGEEFIELIFDKHAKIHYIDIGYSNVASLEIQVASSLWPSYHDYITLMSPVILQNMMDARTGKNKAGCKMFNYNDHLIQEIANQPWDKVKLLFLQPHARNKQVSLEFIRFGSAKCSSVSAAVSKVTNKKQIAEYCSKTPPSNWKTSHLNKVLKSLEQSNNDVKKSPLRFVTKLQQFSSNDRGMYSGVGLERSAKMLLASKTIIHKNKKTPTKNDDEIVYKKKQKTPKSENLLRHSPNNVLKKPRAKNDILQIDCAETKTKNKIPEQCSKPIVCGSFATDIKTDLLNLVDKDPRNNHCERGQLKPSTASKRIVEDVVHNTLPDDDLHIGRRKVMAKFSDLPLSLDQNLKTEFCKKSANTSFQKSSTSLLPKQLHTTSCSPCRLDELTKETNEIEVIHDVIVCNSKKVNKLQNCTEDGSHEHEAKSSSSNEQVYTDTQIKQLKKAIKRFFNLLDWVTFNPSIQKVKDLRKQFEEKHDIKLNRDGREYFRDVTARFMSLALNTQEFKKVKAVGRGIKRKSTDILDETISHCEQSPSKVPNNNSDQEKVQCPICFNFFELYHIDFHASTCGTSGADDITYDDYPPEVQNAVKTDVDCSESSCLSIQEQKKWINFSKEPKPYQKRLNCKDFSGCMLVKCPSCGQKYKSSEIQLHSDDCVEKVNSGCTRMGLYLVSKKAAKPTAANSKSTDSGETIVLD
ncbi:uncharacterized protein LOC143446222 isoform X2 [Clavelina lepadiformis]|uniref:uncharacterized protein LOC143446222 isoform X2 n=1 Tax=Clavelina lepadiformis TaxID=159417 RepID=UPI00404176D7